MALRHRQYRSEHPVAPGRRAIMVTAALLAGALSACAPAARVPYANGLRTIEIDPSLKGPVAGVGIEGHDIVSMTDQMMRDILATPHLTQRPTPPRVIVDAAYFVNDSSQALNKRMVTDRLRVSLNRSSRGRLIFVGRHYADMVAHERELKRSGITDVGTTGLTGAQAGADYRLGGHITSLDSRSVHSGLIQRHNQIIFELVDLETSVVAWSGIYEFARAGADDVVYR